MTTRQEIARVFTETSRELRRQGQRSVSVSEVTSKPFGIDPLVAEYFITHDSGRRTLQLYELIVDRNNALFAAISVRYENGSPIITYILLISRRSVTRLNALPFCFGHMEAHQPRPKCPQPKPDAIAHVTPQNFGEEWWKYIRRFTSS